MHVIKAYVQLRFLKCYQQLPVIRNVRAELTHKINQQSHIHSLICSESFRILYMYNFKDLGSKIRNFYRMGKRDEIYKYIFYSFIKFPK